MFKIIVMLRKRADISREEFIDYYSNHHVPFVHSLLPKGAAIHRRNFVIPRQPTPMEMGAKAMSEPAIRAQIEADERKFLEPGSLRSYVVEVRETMFRTLGEA